MLRSSESRVLQTRVAVREVVDTRRRRRRRLRAPTPHAAPGPRPTPPGASACCCSRPSTLPAAASSRARAWRSWSRARAKSTSSASCGNASMPSLRCSSSRRAARAASCPDKPSSSVSRRLPFHVAITRPLQPGLGRRGLALQLTREARRHGRKRPTCRGRRGRSLSNACPRGLSGGLGARLIAHQAAWTTPLRRRAPEAVRKGTAESGRQARGGIAHE